MTVLIDGKAVAGHSAGVQLPGAHAVVVGRSELVGKPMSQLDVGIHRTPSGLTGDVVTRDLLGHAGWVTPVPGGVGPMTIAMLKNTFQAARLAARGPIRSL
ncbi:hypothetical protein [Nocardia sp. R7R-8]|uniref:hypothetical protein n=1 Tax=Nocardia sp. R7R-8 TaxID=3459304 RepID=UPI00403DF95A